MADLKQLKLLQELANSRHDEATLELAKARQALAAARQQRMVLANYNGDYQQRFGHEVAGGMQGDMMRNYQSFISSVGRAIAQQDTEIIRREAAQRSAEDHWHETRRNLESFRSLQAREMHKARVQEDSKRQKADDEYAQRNAYYGMRTAI
jgi:flagellar FliJ protein